MRRSTSVEFVAIQRPGAEAVFRFGPLRFVHEGPLLVRRHWALTITAAVVLCQIGLVRDAQAYLDPGTGSLIFQAIVAALAASAVFLRIYWHKVKALFSRGQAGPDAPQGSIVESDEGANEPHGRA